MTNPTPPPLPKTNVYIDGFNLYHACFDDHAGRRHWRQYRWLDLATFCAKVFPGHQINRIRYFTALVRPRPSNPYSRARQELYIRALETCPNLTVHKGRFAVNVKKRTVADPLAATPRPANPYREEYVIESEEKGSDVNLASYLLVDGFRQDYEVAIVVSNDSDLAEPIRLVKSELGLNVGLLNPRKTVALDLQGIADFYKHVREWMVRDSQFPTTMTDANGTITKPFTW